MRKREQDRAAPEDLRVGPAVHARPKTSEPGDPSAAQSHNLQQAVGNQAMMRLLQSGAVHARLDVSQPGDPDEVEADRMAEQVVSPAIHRETAGEGKGACPACEGRRVGPATGIHRKTSQSSNMKEPAQNDFLQALGPGQPLEPAVKKSMESGFGRDFEGVRIHNDAKAAESADSINAQAYTSGRDIVFAAQQYAPYSSAGRNLLAHELAHVVQRSQDRAGTGIIHRRADPSKLAQMDIATIKADPDYIENGLVKMTFYGAEEADLFYSDGSILRLGLVPRFVRSPFESVDYHTARSDFADYQESPKTLKFVRDPRHLPADPKMSFAEVLQKYSKTVSFSVEAQSGKIVPNHVNPVTAPFLCKFLLQAEQEYIQNFDAIARGMVKVLEKLKIILELELFRATLPTGGAPRAAAGGAAAKAFDAGRMAEELYLEAKALQNPGRMMLQAATKLSGAAELSAGQKAAVMLEFFKRIGFAISRSGVQDTAEYILMRSEDERYAFKILKATGKFLYGKFDMGKLDYIWTEL